MSADLEVGDRPSLNTSLGAVHALADQILDLLGVRIRDGQLVIHYSEGHVDGADVRVRLRGRSQEGASFRADEADTPS